MDSIDQQQNQDTPFHKLTPALILDGIEASGLMTDARIFPLNSYENRVYQVYLEDGSQVAVKFYRPHRWSHAQIQEEHQFLKQLAALEIPVVAPLTKAEIVQHTTYRETVDQGLLLEDSDSLYQFAGFYIGIFPMVGGHRPEGDQPEQLEIIGRLLGRIHEVGKHYPFKHRPQLTIEDFIQENARYLLESQILPTEFTSSYKQTVANIQTETSRIWQQVNPELIATHGDCHLSNILWREGKAKLLDFDDARLAPAMQDLWMLLEHYPLRWELPEIQALIRGYETFSDFPDQQIRLLEPLRSMRIIAYAAWLAKRQQDPSFQMHFPWFGSQSYWQEHLQILRQQQEILAKI